MACSTHAVFAFTVTADPSSDPNSSGTVRRVSSSMIPAKAVGAARSASSALFAIYPTEGIDEWPLNVRALWCVHCECAPGCMSPSQLASSCCRVLAWSERFARSISLTTVTTCCPEIDTRSLWIEPISSTVIWPGGTASMRSVTRTARCSLPERVKEQPSVHLIVVGSCARTSPPFGPTDLGVEAAHTVMLRDHVRIVVGRYLLVAGDGVPD